MLKKDDLIGFLKPSKNHILIGLIILFNIVGWVGFQLGFSELFLKLVPFHLMLMAVLISLAADVKNTAFYAFMGIAIVLGYGIEVVGVARGDVFGQYNYGSVLGLKLWAVPPLIGLNWWLLAYTSGIIVAEVGIDNFWVKCFAGAGLMVLQDLFIEPIAIKYQYWFWADNTVPHQNYIAWYAFSFVLMFIFHVLKIDKNNKTAWAFYLSTLLFFVFL